MRGLQRINSELQIDQLITIWVKVQTTSLTEDEDKISWALTANSTYSVRSAYEVQFYGLSESPLLHRVWEIKAEGKINFFLWLILQNMVWTADRLRELLAVGRTMIFAPFATRKLSRLNTFCWSAPLLRRFGSPFTPPIPMPRRSPGAALLSMDGGERSPEISKRRRPGWKLLCQCIRSSTFGRRETGESLRVERPKLKMWFPWSEMTCWW